MIEMCLVFLVGPIATNQMEGLAVVLKNCYPEYVDLRSCVVAVGLNVVVILEILTGDMIDFSGS